MGRDRPGSAAKPPAKQASAKKVPISKYNQDQTDKIFDLERENTTLKSKENLLETEIVKMKTKLRRIEELMKKKRSTQSGAMTMLPEDIQRQLQGEIDKINEENQMMKERNKKLKAIEKELAIKHVTKKGPVNKFSHVKGKLPNTRVKQSEQDFLKLCEELKVQLVQGEKQIIQLTTHRDQIQQKQSGSGSNEIMNAIDAQQKELQDILRRTGEVKSNIARDEAMFGESKAYIERKQTEIEELNRECENLSHKNFQINQRAQQAKELSDNLDSIRQERDQIENSIKQITSFPFMKNQSGEQSTQQRATQLQIRLDELKNQIRNAQIEENSKQQEVTELREKVQILKGQNDQIKKQHTEASKNFVEKSRSLNQGDVHVDLFNRDQDAYIRALGDMSSKPESEPIWKDYEFLDRANSKPDSKDEKALKQEIERMKHENKDFAAELDKAQSLLRLQTDIERENRQYYQQEKKRLEILAQSNELKSQELAKRIDGQAKLIMDMKQSLGIENAGSRQLPTMASQNQGPSDFDDEGEMAHRDDNILDIKIIDGVLNQGMIDNFLRKSSGKDSYQEYMTMISVDFYDHKTRTTTLTQGARPYYDAQISFMNRMNPSYINHLQSNKMKLEVWLAENGKKAILLGSSELSLADLIFNEGYGAEVQPVIQKQINISPAPGVTSNVSAGVSLGSLGVKMRLRKPIADLKRFNRDMDEVKNATLKAENLNFKSNQKIVTIQVVKCKDLHTKSSDVTKIAPYFTYQFFTYEEKYSITTRGANPAFHDSQSYSLTLDEQTINYLNQNNLNVVFIDDEAPLTGIARGGQGDGDGVDDLIGIAKVPLADITKGVGVDGEFDIRAYDGEVRGKAHIKITVVAAAPEGKTQKDMQDSQKMAYTAQWETDIIYRIAQKLGRLSLDVELMFGIFSRGTRSCTFEDFKYCCLQRLNMRNEITEKELDLFLSGNARLQNKAIIEQRDFVEIFTAQIIKARNDVLNQEARDETYARFQQQQQSFKYGESPDKTITTVADFQRKDALNTLVSCILKSSYDIISNEVTKVAGKAGQLTTEELRKILHAHGQASDFEAQSVTNQLSAAGIVYKQKFDDLLDEALIDARFSSQAVDKFKRMISFMPQQISDLMKEKDINKDGNLNFDGFKAAILKAGDIQDFKMMTEELKEIFNLLSKKKNFAYAEYIIEQSADNRVYFTDIKNLPSIEDSINASTILEKSAMSEKRPGDPLVRAATVNPVTMGMPSSSTVQKPTSLIVAKQKIEQFMISQDVTLSMLFNVIDSNSDNTLSKAEFKQKMRALHMGLEEEELEALFRDLDVNSDAKISYNEFVKQFTAVNTASIIRRIRRILYGASISAETIFNKHTIGQELKLAEFKNLINQLIPQPRLADYETLSIFNELDHGNRGSIAKAKFLDWFGQDEQEKQFQYGIEDIIKPLNTYLNRNKNLTIEKLFAKYDQNKNQMMSAKELAVAMKAMFDFEMTDEEVQTMHEFFRAKFRRSEVKKHEFKTILDKKSVRKYDSNSARESLKRIKAHMSKGGSKDIATLLSRSRCVYPGEVMSRNFKFHVFQMGVLTQQEVNNLSMYMDRNNDGLIKISDVEMALSGDRYSPVSGVSGSSK